MAIMEARPRYCVLYQADVGKAIDINFACLPPPDLSLPLPPLSFNGRIHPVMTWKSGRRLQPGFAGGGFTRAEQREDRAEAS